jgi:CDP-diacylglycerol--glycerol-3-phosphate 3-phosphatidyltransferase
MEDSSKTPVWNVANYLTIARILAIPVFIVLLIMVEPETYDHDWLALDPASPQGDNYLLCIIAAILFGLASITDYLDGFLARRYNLTTNLGKLLDPLADKLLVELHRLPGWMALVVISREIGITALRGIAGEQGMVISASKLGKYKTATQMPALVGLIIYYDFPLFIFHEVNCFAVGMVLFTIAVFLTVWSGIDYFAKFWKYMV